VAPPSGKTYISTVSLKASPRFLSPGEVSVGEDKVVCHRWAFVPPQYYLVLVFGILVSVPYSFDFDFDFDFLLLILLQKFY
jgi:hypothetical protein